MSPPAKPRRIGLLVIVVVLSAAAVVPGIIPRTLAGTPQAAPVPGPPGVGDCVTDPIDPSWDSPAVLDYAPGATNVTYSYPRLAISPCRGSRYGEVTVVIQTPAEPVISISSDGTFVNDANVETCPPAASAYVGIAMTEARRAPLIGPWYPSQVIEVAASIPSIRQTAAGQHWLACIVYLGSSAAKSRSIADQERYDTSVRAAMSTGQQRDRIGTCAVGTDLTGGELGLIDCRTVHRSEVFATGGSNTQPLSRADLLDSCAQVVQRLTRIPQLTTSGLTVEVLAIDSNGTPLATASIPAGVNLSCGVTADNQRTLDGSLLALGSQPIPWT